MLKMISFEQAIDILAGQPAEPEKEFVPIDDVLGRILAEDMTAVFPMPSFDKSPFDGFAFRSSDTPGVLEISGESKTGCQKLERLRAGTAVRIFTGAPVPDGADVIMKAEDTETDGAAIHVRDAMPAGTNVIRRGEIYPAGTLLETAGSRLTPAAVGVLASQGYRDIAVFRKPKVLLISTGSELLKPGDSHEEYKIYNSSYYSLSGYLKLMGFEVVCGGNVPDDLERITHLIADGLAGDADLVMTTGGASVGDYDFAVHAARDLGLETLFWKVNAKPGGALMAARNDNGKLLISLSGNPAAAIMSLLVVLQPYLRRLSGAKLGNVELELPILSDMPKTSSAVRMLRGHPTILGDMTCFEENQGRENGNIASFEACSMIGIIPGNSGKVSAGTRIRVLKLPDDLC